MGIASFNLVEVDRRFSIPECCHLYISRREILKYQFKLCRNKIK
jgi:hypothetical protein